MEGIPRRKEGRKRGRKGRGRKGGTKEVQEGGASMIFPLKDKKTIKLKEQGILKFAIYIQLKRMTTILQQLEGGNGSILF